MVGVESLGEERDPTAWLGEISWVRVDVGVSLSGRSFDLRDSVYWGLKIWERGRLKGDVVQKMVRKVKEVLLRANSSVFFDLLESLHECWDGVKGGGAERMACFDCSMRGHVVLGPLDVSAWFCVLDICVSRCDAEMDNVAVDQGYFERGTGWNNVWVKSNGRSVCECQCMYVYNEIRTPTQHPQHVPQQRPRIIVLDNHLEQSQMHDIVYAN